MAHPRLTGPGGPGGGPLAVEALELARAGLAAVDPASLVRRELAARPFAATAFLALGKAAAAMAAAVETTGRPALLVRPHTAPPLAAEGWEELTGGHPVPDRASLAAGRRVFAFVTALGPGDRLLVLLSGGASACVERPAAGLSIDQLAATNRALLGGGLPIDRCNAVRKHLSTIKGGGLLRAGASRVCVLALSDVPGDDEATIASGPFSADPTTFADALAAVAALELPPPVRRHLEAGAAGRRRETLAPGDPDLVRVDHRLLAGRLAAADAAAGEAAARGFAVTRAELDGDAEAAARRLVAAGRALPGERVALVAGGETTVELGSRAGIGGRNQQLALAAARELEGGEGEVLLALATDGVDGVSTAAGALVDGRTWSRIGGAGISPGDALAGRDATPALAAAGALLGGGATGTNVADLALYLRDRGRHGGALRCQEGTEESGR